MHLIGPHNNKVKTAAATEGRDRQMNKDRDSKLNNLTFYLKTLKNGGGRANKIQRRRKKIKIREKIFF